MPVNLRPRMTSSHLWASVARLVVAARGRLGDWSATALIDDRDLPEIGVALAIVARQPNRPVQRR
jgi:hypothetical protein